MSAGSVLDSSPCRGKPGVVGTLLHISINVGALHLFAARTRDVQ